MNAQIETQLNYGDLKDFVEAHPGSKIYIGGDSTRFKINREWFADYTVVAIVHIGASVGRGHGGRIFGLTKRQRDYDKNKNRPRMRLMTEVALIAETYLTVAEIFPEVEIEVHLDINPNEAHGSSCVVQEAIGYIRGMCNTTPKIKPIAWAASTVADRGRRLFV